MIVIYYEHQVKKYLLTFKSVSGIRENMRLTTFRFVYLSIIAVLLILYLGGTLHVFVPKTHVYANSTDREIRRIELLDLTNAERAKVGAKPLKLDARLNETAQARSDDMMKRNYFSHYDPVTGKSLVNIGLTYPGLCQSASENITDNIYDNASALARLAVGAWVNSPPHYKAMIDINYDLVGFGISGTKIVQHFCDLK